MQVTIRRFHRDTTEKSTATADNLWTAAQAAFWGMTIEPGQGNVVRAVDSTGTIIGTVVPA